MRGQGQCGSIGDPLPRWREGLWGCGSSCCPPPQSKPEGLGGNWQRQQQARGQNSARDLAWLFLCLNLYLWSSEAALAEGWLVRGQGGVSDFVNEAGVLRGPSPFLRMPSLHFHFSSLSAPSLGRCLSSWPFQSSGATVLPLLSFRPTGPGKEGVL